VRNHGEALGHFRAGVGEGLRADAAIVPVEAGAADVVANVGAAGAVGNRARALALQRAVAGKEDGVNRTAPQEKFFMTETYDGLYDDRPVIRIKKSSYCMTKAVALMSAMTGMTGFPSYI